MKRNLKIVQDEKNPVPAEVIAGAIVKISESMKLINETRLTREAIVTLIHERSKIARTDIRIVLANLDQMEQVWLKPLKK